MNDTLRHRVVEVQCDLGDNRPEESDRFILASGYRLTPRLILTSAHAVNRRGAIRVRGRDKKSHIARIARIDGVDLVGDEEQADLAILELEHELSGVRPTKYAAVDVDVRQGEVVKGCWALGYPWFKNRPIGERVEQRFIAQLNGEIPMAETNQADMLTFRVNASPRPLPSTAELLSRSPWQGISGAAVFVADRLLAVITEHQPRSGESSLTITPITHFERLPHPEVWRRALNFDPDELLVLSGQRRITDGARRRWPSKRILLLLAMAVLVLRGDTVRNILPLVSGEPMAVESATGDQQEFLLVAPRFAGGLMVCSRTDTKWSVPWKGPSESDLDGRRIDSGALVWSSFSAPEMVFREDTTLFFTYRDAHLRWVGPNRIRTEAEVRMRRSTLRADGDLSLIQETPRHQSHGDFLVLTPTTSGDLALLRRNNALSDFPWASLETIDVPRPIDSVAMVEGIEPRSLDVVGLSSGQLLYLHRAGSGRWTHPTPIIIDGEPISGISGAPAMIRSNVDRSPNLELVAPLDTGGIAHFWRDENDPHQPWHAGARLGAGRHIDAVTILEHVTGPRSELIVVARTKSELATFVGSRDTWQGPYPFMCGSRGVRRAE